MKTGPNILEHFSTPKLLRGVRFVQPANGKEIKVLFDGNDPTFPTAGQLAVRELTLQSGNAVPFHKHQGKREKVYVVLEGRVNVLTAIGNEPPQELLLEIGESTLISPGVSHALHCEPIYGLKQCKIMVVLSDQEATNITWQDGMKELLENKHLQASK